MGGQHKPVENCSSVCFAKEGFSDAAEFVPIPTFNCLFGQENSLRDLCWCSIETFPYSLEFLLWIVKVFAIVYSLINQTSYAFEYRRREVVGHNGLRITPLNIEEYFEHLRDTLSS